MEGHTRAGSSGLLLAAQTQGALVDSGVSWPACSVVALLYEMSVSDRQAWVFKGVFH